MNETQTSHSDHPKLASGLARLGLDVPAEAVENLLAYVELLKEWSRTYNLIAPGDRNALLGRHILDSLSIAPWLRPGSLLDVGTGAGFPGLPLAIIKPEMEVTLVDGAGKKIRFIRHVARTLKLENIHPLHQRAEQMDGSQQFANITSRAFSSLSEFAELVKPCMDANSRLLAMKGVYPRKELKALPAWIKVDSVEKLTVPFLQAERHLVIMSLSDQTTQ